MSIKTELQSNNIDLQNILNTINNLPDAGVGEVYAAIGVIYPEGLICTCTGEGKTWTAKTTVGQWVFPVFKAGTYTVTATDGTNTNTQTVEITAEGQFETISLAFELVLFDNGSKVEWSGYVRIASDNFCSIANTIVCRRNSGISLSYTGAVAYTYEPILLDGYSTLNVRFKSVSGLSSYIGVVNPSVSDKDNPSAWAASRECSVAAYGSGGTATLDISECSGQTLAVVLGEGCVKNEAGSSCEVDRVWLT